MLLEGKESALFRFKDSLPPSTVFSPYRFFILVINLASWPRLSKTSGQGRDERSGRGRVADALKWGVRRYPIEMRKLKPALKAPSASG